MSKKVLFTSNVGIRPLGSGVGWGGSGDGFSILELELAGAKMGGGGATLGNSFHFFQKQTQLLNLHPTIEFKQPV